MSFGKYVRKNLVPALVAGGGALVALWGFGSDVWGLWTAGLSPGMLQMSGFVLFVVAVISIVYRQHQLLEEHLGKLTSPTQPQIEVDRGPKPITFDLRRVDQPTTVKKEGRPYLSDDMTPEALIGVYKGHTAVQGQKLASSFVGHWINLNGFVYDVYSPIDGTRSLMISTAEEPGGALKVDGRVRLSFNSEWFSRLDIMRPGQPISVTGEIEKIESHAVWLINCEIIS